MNTSAPLLLFILCITLFSCQQKADHNNHHEKILSAKSALNNQETSMVIHIIQDYYTLSDAFIEEDMAKVIAGTQTLRTSTSILKKVLSTDTLRPNYNTLLDPLMVSIEEVAKAQNDIEYKRIPFSGLSNHVYELLQSIELSGTTIYHQYCPMAFNDKGAYWLSPYEDIQNPYFGKKMLECGETEDRID